MGTIVKDFTASRQKRFTRKRLKDMAVIVNAAKTELASIIFTIVRHQLLYEGHGVLLILKMT